MYLVRAHYMPIPFCMIQVPRKYTVYKVVCFLLGNYPKESIQHTEHGESLKLSL